MIDNFFVKELAFFFTYYVFAASYVYKYNSAPKKETLKRHSDIYFFYSEVISIVHAVNVLVFGAIILYYTGIDFGQNAKYVHKHSAAYFMYDWLMGIYFGYNDLLMTIHHIISICACSTIYTTSYGGTEFMVTTIIGEITNPFVLTRTALKIAKLTETSAYAFCEYAFAISFVFARAMFGPFWTYKMFSIANNPLQLKICTGLIVFVSLIWVEKIMSLISDRLGGAMTKHGLGKVHTAMDKGLTLLRRNKPVQLTFYSAAFCGLIAYPIYYYGFIEKTLL